MKSSLNSIQESGWAWQPVSTDISIGPAAARGASGEILRYNKVYRCIFCKGSGFRPKGVRCPVCKGKGKILVQPPVRMCVFCNGTGENQPRMALTCSVCKGKGLVAIEEPFQICPSCNGKGKMRGAAFYCPECKGKGIISIRERGSFGHPAGTEKKAMKAIYRLEKGGRNAIADRLKISTAYAEIVIKSLLKKRLLEKEGSGMVALTPPGKEYVETRLHWVK